MCGNRKLFVPCSEMSVLQNSSALALISGVINSTLCSCSTRTGLSRPDGRRRAVSYGRRRAVSYGRRGQYRIERITDACCSRLHHVLPPVVGRVRGSGGEPGAAALRGVCPALGGRRRRLGRQRWRHHGRLRHLLQLPAGGRDAGPLLRRRPLRSAVPHLLPV